MEFGRSDSVVTRLEPANDYAEVKPSKNITASSRKIQLGLFAKKNIPKDTIITWYTGKTYLSKTDAAKAMKRYSGSEAAVKNAYYMDCRSPDDNSLLYIIDGYEPAEAQDHTCLGCMINHAQDANIVFRSTPNSNALFGVGVTVVTLRDIESGEELMAYYSKAYDKQLMDSTLPQIAYYDIHSGKISMNFSQYDPTHPLVGYYHDKCPVHGIHRLLNGPALRALHTKLMLHSRRDV